MCCLDNACTIGIVYQAFGVFVLDPVDEDRLVIQELAEGVAVGDVTVFSMFAPSDLVV